MRLQQEPIIDIDFRWRGYDGQVVVYPLGCLLWIILLIVIVALLVGHR